MSTTNTTNTVSQTGRRARTRTRKNAAPLAHAAPSGSVPAHPVIPLSPLAIAVRAYTPLATPAAVPDEEKPRKARQRARTPRAPRTASPPLALFLDTETTVDASQALLFGSSRLINQKGERVAEHLLAGETMTLEQRATIAQYAELHLEEVERIRRRLLRVLPREEYLRQVFWPVVLKGRGLLVGFNLPFDLARISVGCGEARGGRYAGGFSLTLATYRKDGSVHENRHRPRIVIKSLDSKRALMAFTRYQEPDRVDLIPEGAEDGKPDAGYVYRGHFLDLRTLAFALTNRGHSLASACKAFGVAIEDRKGHAEEHGVVTPEYIGYNCQDVRATAALFAAMQAEYERHPIALPITAAYSPASIGKAYMQAMGIRSILERQPDFPKDVLGFAMAAYYGGRAECRIRQVPVPVVYLDFLSMYPTVCSLLGIWRLLTCARIAVEDATAEVTALLAGITADRCLDPALWRDFVGLVQLEPEGDILPVRAHYGGEAAWQIGVNPLTGKEPLWYTVADAVASTLLSGKPPRVVQALRFVPEGKAKGLRPTSLRGQVPVDPAIQDFFRVVIEERHRLKARTDLSTEERERLDAFLKVLANATAYGIFAELNRQDLPAGERREVEVYGAWDEPFTSAVSGPEEPGAFCFPPIAACITGAARLLLALLEQSVTELGGSYAMCDTDSMAIVATEAGGLVPCPGGSERLSDGREAVRALSWAQVDVIRARLDVLNPYNRTAVPDMILKLEPENLDPQTHEQRQLWCYAISAKRYALFNVDEGGEQDGRPILRKYSEHGLGHLLNPTDPPDAEAFDEENEGRTAWMGVLWEGLISEALGLPFVWPDWIDRPALGRITASNPEMLRPFATWNKGKPYARQVKPYNFLLTAYVKPLGYPEGADPAHFHLVAPFESDPRKWSRLPWRNLYDESGTRYTIRAESSLYVVPGVVEVKTYRDVLADYRRHAETKSLAPSGAVCDGATRGLLRRRPVSAAYVTHVGKESNRLEEVNAGLVHDPEEVYTEYQDLAHGHSPWQSLVMQVLKRMPRALLAKQVGLSERMIAAVRNGHALPRAAHQEAFMRAAGEYARAQLRAAGTIAPRDDLEACAAYLALQLATGASVWSPRWCDARK
jgi:hypothetical protein